MPDNHQTDWRFHKVWLTLMLLVVGLNGRTYGIVFSLISDNRSYQTDKNSETAGADFPEQKRSPAAAKTERTRAMASETQRQALQSLDEILANSSSVHPLETRIFVCVEAASVLWRFDKTRAEEVLKSSLKQLAQLLKEEKAAPPQQKARQKMYAILLRKITALNPQLAIETLLTSDSETLLPQAVANEWREEARALMVVAFEQIEKNPAYAAQLAETSLGFGLSDWISFLRILGERDRREAERVALRLMERLRESTVPPAFLRNLRSFVFDANGSKILQERFFQTLAFQLQRDLRVTTPYWQLQGNLDVAREMSVLAAASLPHWRPEFVNLIAAYESLFATHSLSSAAPERKIINAPETISASPEDVQELREAGASVERLRELKAKDREYQQLATKAAARAEARLAEEFLSKIVDENLRNETTIAVYSPLVRYALQEKQWSAAQEYAKKVFDPLGRTMMYEAIAQAIAKTSKESNRVEETYALALDLLENAEPDDRVIRALWLLATASLRTHFDIGRNAVSLGVDKLNLLSRKTEFIEESAITGAAGTWVRYPHHMLNPGEIFDLNEMLGAAFAQLAQRDLQESKYQAVNLNHWGMRSLAQLAICRVLLAEKPVEKLSDKPKAPPKPAAPSRQPAKTA